MTRRPFSAHRFPDRERLIALTIASEHLQWGVQQLLGSKRWRLGKFLGNVWRRLTLRPVVPLADDFIEDTLQRIDPLLRPTVPPPIPQRSAGLTIFQDTPVDIVICVKDAEKYVRRCLRSLTNCVTNPGNWIIVDDASGSGCRRALEEFCESQDRPIQIRRHQWNLGYTRSANEGIQAAESEYVLLLNSDTELTPDCIPRMLRALADMGDPCAAVGPVSNAASWQSVPQLSTGKDWSVNPLPFGWTAADMAELVHQAGEARYPEVPLLNGFCMLLNRLVWNEVGGFDAESFPHGYGEEDDFCLRAVRQGFKLCVADDAFVYHAKTKSFAPAERARLVRKGTRQLQRIHGHYLSDAVQAMKHSSPLAERRHSIQNALSQLSHDSAEVESGLPRVLFVLPVSGGGGGAHSIVQEATEMMLLGLPARVAVPGIHRSKYLANYPEVDRSLFLFYRDEEELFRAAADVDIAVATIFHSVDLVAAMWARNESLLPMYYVQDYEPHFFDLDSKPWHQARESYQRIPGMRLFSKTDWLCDTVEQHHGVAVAKVQPGIDHNIFFPPLRPRPDGGPVKLAAMVRPSTPRRGPQRTVSIMQQLHHDFGEGIEIHLFGARKTELDELAGSDFPYVDHGILSRREMGRFLRSMDVFVDFSDYQAFGRTGLEAMACGCAVIVPSDCGTDEYARPEHNCLSVATKDTNECLMATRRLVVERELRERFSVNGAATAARFTVRDAALSEIALFDQFWQANADGGRIALAQAAASQAGSLALE